MQLQIGVKSVHQGKRTGQYSTSRVVLTFSAFTFVFLEKVIQVRNNQ